MLLTQTAQFLFVASLWGLTNPFIKRGASGVEKVTEKYKKASVWTRQWQEWKFLFRRWQVVLLSLIWYTMWIIDRTITRSMVNAFTLVCAASCTQPEWIGCLLCDFGAFRYAILSTRAHQIALAFEFAHGMLIISFLSPKIWPLLCRWWMPWRLSWRSWADWC